MKKLSLALCLLFLIALPSSAQRIDKPTLTPTPCSESQKATIFQGIQLHDAKRYGEAIAKYQEVLSNNPDCTNAIYELSMSYYYNGEKTKAMETAYKGSKYKSAELPLFYLTMANVLDDIGKGNEAQQVYIDAIKILEGDKEMRPHLSSLHFNLGVSYRRQKKDAEARQEMKLAIIANDRYASPHYQLADIFFFGRYKIPALLAAARFISLEYNTDRSKRAAAIIYNVVGSTAAQKGADNNIVISIDPSAPNDEGDFGAAELLMTMVDALGKTGDTKTKDMTAEEKFVERLDSVIGYLDGKDKNLKSTFSAKAYFPFVSEMRRLGFVKPFGYLVLVHSGDEQALKWIRDNDKQVSDFLNWAKAYSAIVD
jgi:tetratricopeptide (TPR) repeat protein